MEGHRAPYESRYPSWEVGVLACLAVAVRLIDLDLVHNYDDYFQFLTASSLLRRGVPELTVGVEYDRALLHTYLVAGAMRLFGETTYAARLPSVLFGAGVVVLVFFWVRAVAGRTPAWIAGGLLALDPGAIDFSQLIRFYSLHVLLFVSAAVGAFALVSASRASARELLLASLVFVLVGVAYHLHPTTLIGGIALVAWVVVDRAPSAVNLARVRPRAALWWGLAAIAAVLVAALALAQSGVLYEWVRRFRSVPQWAEEHRDAVGYYVRRLRRSYPLLLGLFPLAALVSIARFGRPAVLATVLFVVPLVLHSFAAFKAERYLSYAMPFFFVTWGMAVAAVLPAMLRASEGAVSRVLNRSAEGRTPRLAGLLLCVFALLVAASANPAFQASGERIRPGTVPTAFAGPDWRGASRLLAHELGSAEVVLSSGGGHALYQLGRLDVHIGGHLLRSDPPREFELDRRFRLPVISRPESLSDLMVCHASGLVTIEERHWRVSWAANADLAGFIEGNMERIPLPNSLQVRAYRWNAEGTVEPSKRCSVVERVGRVTVPARAP